MNKIVHTQLLTFCMPWSWQLLHCSSQPCKDKLERFKQTTLKKSKVVNANMDPSILWPPEAVRGMKVLDVSTFKKTIDVPVAKVKVDNLGPVMKCLKNYYLKLRQFSSHEDSPSEKNFKLIYLNPLLYSEKEVQIKSEVEAACRSQSDSSDVKFTTQPFEMKYEHWDANTVLRAVLPLEEDGVAGFSKVGHIIHLNLKEHLEPYKNIIGTVLLDKSIDDVKMVVNKIDTIDNSDNTFRSFSMEVLAGEGETVTTLKQNKCTFTFDFAKVYWNPRLSTEHEMIIKKLYIRDVLYDVMAGVGPFSVPAAFQKKCEVLANDLNPESYRWLVHNTNINKVQGRLKCYNLDGKDFIGSVIKNDLLSRWKDPDFDGTIHVTMNLPSIAVEFLPQFVGLLSDVDLSSVKQFTEPIVHVYMFSKDQKESSCVTRVAFYLGLVDVLPDFDGEVSAALDAMHQFKKTSDVENNSGVKNADSKNSADDRNFGKRGCRKLVEDRVNIPGLHVEEVSFVRRVAPFKVMVRVSVRLTKAILVDTPKAPQVEPINTRKTELENCEQHQESSSKRLKLDV